MRFVKDRIAGAGAFTKEDFSTGRIDGAEAIRGARSVSSDAANRRVIVVVAHGTVIWRAKVFQIMAIDNIEGVDVAIAGEIWVQRKAQQTEIPPTADFLRDVQ